MPLTSRSLARRVFSASCSLFSIVLLSAKLYIPCLSDGGYSNSSKYSSSFCLLLLMAMLPIARLPNRYSSWCWLGYFIELRLELADF